MNDTTTINNVGVLGCGLMGSGIAQVCAQSGYRTTVLEVNEPVLKKGLARIEKFLSEGVTRGKVTPDARDATRVSSSTAGTATPARTFFM